MRPGRGHARPVLRSRCPTPFLALALLLLAGSPGCRPSATEQLRPWLGKHVRVLLAVSADVGADQNWLDDIVLVSLDEDADPPTVRVRFAGFETLDGGPPAELDVELATIVQVVHEGRYVYDRE